MQEFHETVTQQTHRLISNPLQDLLQIDASDYRQFLSIFVIINANRSFSPAWTVAGCHVPYSSTHAHCVIIIKKTHRKKRISCQGCAFAHHGLLYMVLVFFFACTQPNPQQSSANSLNSDTAAAEHGTWHILPIKALLPPSLISVKTENGLCHILKHFQFYQLREHWCIPHQAVY